jgi:hypothetical protein
MPKVLLSDQAFELALRDPVLLGWEPLRAQARLYPSWRGGRVGGSVLIVRAGVNRHVSPYVLLLR